MNERIREIYKEARRILYMSDNFMEEWEFKFAEAVVKECIQVCQSRVGNSDYNTGRMHCVSDIKEHFGIK